MKKKRNRSNLITTTAMKPQLLAVLCFCACLAASSAIGEWGVLTKLNFSSQIRHHPHILLLVTVPWSGESRSLMKEVSAMVTDRREEFSELVLMVLHKNMEKILADAIGAANDEHTVLYYHHSRAFKYRGMLRAQSILSSIRSRISALPGELPLEFLGTPAELEAFLGSTDKALLLVEFCGWTPKLMAKDRTNVTAYIHGGQDFVGWRNRGLTLMGTEMLKDMEAKMMCDVNAEVSQVPWFAGFGSVNDAATFEATTNNRMENGLSSCSFEAFQQFDSFFTKFVRIAEDNFLPSDKHRYGVVSNRSMLSTLGIGDSSSWLAVLHFSGCPGCVKVIKKEEDLTDIMLMDNSVISELEGNGHPSEPILPANWPSIVLFVDRSSHSEEIRTQSKETLDSFRELALNIYNSYKVSERHEILLQDYQAPKGTSGPPRLRLSRASRLIKLKEKISSITIVNDGKQISLDKLSSDLQGSSLRELLTSVLQHKTGSKLSSLAKEMGFQLLSDDIDINFVNKLPSHTKTQLAPGSPVEEKEDLFSRGVDFDQGQPTESPSLSDDEKKADSYLQSSSEAEPLALDHDTDVARDVNIEETNSSKKNLGLKASFFFSDGNYRSLEALTSGSKIPQLVIVDPTSEQHYVFPEANELNYSSMADFFSRLLVGSLSPYEQSESYLHSRTEPMPTRYELDDIPRLTSNSFPKMVLGVDQFDKDSLVLFGNKWCGFCQRMELVVREVYRSMRSYLSTYKTGLNDADNLKDLKPKLPSIYLLDCTLNDCKLILRSINQTEVYPALVLFPAEKKDAIPYEGQMAVADIIKFIADHGSHSKHLIEKIGTIKGRGNPNLEKHYVLRENLPQVTVGSILTATDKLQNVEPFGESKVLIVKANRSTGFQGLIINKRILWDALHELEDEFDRFEILAEAPFSYGGPLIQRGAPLVALSRRAGEDEHPRIFPDIYYLDQSATYRKFGEIKSGNDSVSDHWFFLGYSSWGWDQLYQEISHGAWDAANGGLTDLVWP